MDPSRRCSVGGMETSAGILLYRHAPRLQVLIAHMGGPFWARRDAAAWSIPKGLYEPGEQPLDAALREFAEEVGRPAPDVDYTPLGEFRQPSGKRIAVFTAEADIEAGTVASSTFELEWPPGSGRMQEFPEVDEVRWFEIEPAREKLVKGQRPLLDALLAQLA